MAGNDVFLYSVPSDADRDDARLRDPAGVAAPSASGSAPVSGVGAITANGRKQGQSAAPVSAVGAITATGFKAASGAAPMSGVGAITAGGSKSASGSAPVEGVGVVTATGSQAADGGAVDPGTRGKKRREYYEPPKPDLRLEIERGVTMLTGGADRDRQQTVAQRAAYDEEEDLIWLLAA